VRVPGGEQALTSESPGRDATVRMSGAERRVRTWGAHPGGGEAEGNSGGTEGRVKSWNTHPSKHWLGERGGWGGRGRGLRRRREGT